MVTPPGLRQEDNLKFKPRLYKGFQTSLSYSVKPCLRKQSKTKQRAERMCSFLKSSEMSICCSPRSLNSWVGEIKLVLLLSPVFMS